MDKDSKNYNAAAEEDDGSCAYTGSIHFWYGKATSDSLIANGITSLTFYVDGAIIGSYASSVYFTGDPACGQSSVVTSTKELGNVKTKTSTYIVKDDSGAQLWTGSVTYDATKSCTSYEMTWE